MSVKTRVFAGAIALTVVTGFAGPAAAQSLNCTGNPGIDCRFFPIDLKCPLENNGALQLISANQLHWYQRIVVRYEHNIATAVSVSSGSDPGTSFKVLKQVDLLTEKDPSLLRYGQHVAEKLRALPMRDICQGSEESRRRYLETLKANKVRLGLP
jgi:hypothetical protein